MKTIGIPVIAPIFKDPEFCSDLVSFCDHLRREALSKFCSQFNDIELKWVAHDFTDFRVHKCDECKAIYALEKERNARYQKIKEDHKNGNN